jgi:hypothetical protein
VDLAAIGAKKREVQEAFSSPIVRKSEARYRLSREGMSLPKKG